MDPLHITEFGSDRYFSKLRQLDESAQNAASPSSSASPHAQATSGDVLPPPVSPGSTFTLPLGRQRSLDNELPPLALRPSEAKKRSLGHDLTSLRTQRRPTFAGSFGRLSSKVNVTHKIPSIAELSIAEDPSLPLTYVPILSGISYLHSPRY